MNIVFSKEAVGRGDAADMLVRGVFAQKSDVERAVRVHDKLLGGHLAEHVNDEGFAGKLGEKLVIHTHGKMPAKKLVLLGLGPNKGFDLEQLRRSAGAAYRLAASSKCRVAAIALPFGIAGKDSEALQALCEGFLLAEYGFRRYKQLTEERRVETIIVSVRDAVKSAALREAERTARAVAEAVNYARDLVNTPAIEMSPKHLADEATKLAEQKRVSLKTYDRADVTKMGCGGILAVAQGSAHDPVMIHLTYKPAGKAKKRIVLVGKAVTFDSGGLSLKPADGMMDMKIDMAGAAAVMAVFKALPKLMPDVEVHGIAGAVENMPSGTAIRPGDIVRTMSGKTIEILNTDAEGRVTLADTLHYGAQLKPDAMIDLATLTGACMVALGHDVAGLMTDDKRLAAKLMSASEKSGEKLWELPLVADYAEHVKSRHADVKNITGTRYGGAITAGLFLKEFVPEGMPWAHLDIAGPAYNEKDYDDYRAWGASGYGARLLLEYLMSL